MAALAHCKSLPRPVRPSCKEMWILDVEGREQSLGKKSLETGDGEAQQPLFPFLGWSTTGMCLLVSWMPSRNNRCYEVFPTRSLECFIVLDFFTQNLESYLKKKQPLSLYFLFFLEESILGAFSLFLREEQQQWPVLVFREE